MRQLGGFTFQGKCAKIVYSCCYTRREHVGRIHGIIETLRLVCFNVSASFVTKVRLLGGEHFSPSAKATCTRSGGEAFSLRTVLSAPFSGVHRGIVGEMVWCYLFAAHDPLTLHQIVGAFLFLMLLQGADLDFCGKKCLSCCILCSPLSISSPLEGWKRTRGES
jgi:hypothetical protein